MGRDSNLSQTFIYISSDLCACCLLLCCLSQKECFYSSKRKYQEYLYNLVYIQLLKY